MADMKAGFLFLICGLLAACANVDIAHNTRVTLSAVPVCYNANCRNRTYISISKEEWQPVAELFEPPHKTPLQERLAIRQAIAHLETIAGKYTPTRNDLAKNSNPFNEDGRMDCVDESTNTSNYLLLLQQHGFLRWHQLESRAFRTHFMFDQHYTARISERKTSTLYAVDSWHRGNGQPPMVQEYVAWLFKLGSSQEENPD